MTKLQEINHNISLLEQIYYNNWYYGEEEGYKGIFTKNNKGVIELFIISTDDLKREQFLALGLATKAVTDSKVNIEFLLEGVEDDERVKQIRTRLAATTKGTWKRDKYSSSFISEDHKHVIYCKRKELVFKNLADLDFLLNYVSDARCLLNKRL